MSVEDDLAARELMARAEELPASALIARAWAEDMLLAMRRAQGIMTEQERQRQDELRWLHASLEADMLPDWCIAMVLKNWH